MPISRGEFDQEPIDLALLIVSLLARRPDLAFTTEEIRQLVLEAGGGNATTEEVREALDTLVAQGRVRRKEFGGYQWYTIVQRRIGFLQE